MEQLYKERLYKVSEVAKMLIASNMSILSFRVDKIT